MVSEFPFLGELVFSLFLSNGYIKGSGNRHSSKYPKSYTDLEQHEAKMIAEFSLWLN